MQPPINELPEGEWYCPPCQDAAVAQDYFSPPSDMPTDQAPIIPTSPRSNREPSVASTSRSTIPPTPKSRLGRPRRKAMVIEEEEPESEVEEFPPPTPRGRTRQINKPSRPSRRLVQEEQIEVEEEAEEEEEEEQMDDTPIPPPRSSRKRKREREIMDPSPAPIPRVRLRLATTRNSAKGKEREEQEETLGMFDGILRPEERDITKTIITNHDKQLFERSRLEAEKKLTPPPPPSVTSTTSSHAFSRSSISVSASDLDSPSVGPSRPTRSATLHYIQSQIAPTPSPGPSTPGGPLYNITTRNDPETLRIKTIRFGQYDIKTWYDAPFPEEYASIPDGRMWICEFCLKYMKSRFQAMRHRLKCKVRHPPGDEIYRDSGISIFEVDGRKNKVGIQDFQKMRTAHVFGIRYIARTCVYCQRCFWTTSRFSTMWSRSCST
jgi:histone acetyltransferase MYST4